MIYEKTIFLPKPFDEALEHVKEIFTAEGFRVLSEIDMQAVLKKDVYKDIDRFVIVGVCNSDIASRALDVEPQIGVLLTCNIVVREADSGVIVEVLNPGLMASITGSDEMTPIANEARRLVHDALSQLKVASLT